ncbi:MAG: hypothetical protein ABDH23_07370 [Endomicrobiia bacterium]
MKKDIINILLQEIEKEKKEKQKKKYKFLEFFKKLIRRLKK